MNPRGYIEPCLGAGAVLLALLDPSLVPFCGYMGGKRKLARPILRHGFGLKPGDGAREVVIAEAGPLGWVWSELLSVERAGRVAEALRAWEGLDVHSHWLALSKAPIPSDCAQRAAATLFLQAGQALGKSLRVLGDYWKVAGFAHLSKLARAKGFRERILVEPMARRLDAIARALSRLPVRFHHGDYADALPAGDLSGWDIYWDPPYQGATSYAVDLPRARVLADAQDLRARGATVAVSEAVPLPLRRWRHLDLTREGGKPEWLTCSRWPVAEQVRLPLSVGA